ncbi:MAG: ribulose 1,5-bisphosphate carboxylase [Candidatus Lokiarchaeota archaeon]|nr:ribulose 1,5-bisphosphate carboxylase [Candidatus Lokiarchaeota archaeon]
MKTEDLEATPKALEDGIDREKYIIATYTAALSSKMEATTLAQFAAIEQSTGTWIRVPEETEQVRKEHIAKVLGCYEIPNFEYEVEVDKNALRYYVFRIAFPVTNMINSKGKFNFPLMFTAIYGNISMGGKLKLVDFQLPKKVLKLFKGPKYGIQGFQKLLGVTDRPILNNMIKPCTGHSCGVAADLAYKAFLGGCDVVKDDELIADAEFNTLEDRLSMVMEAADKAASETGEKKIYTIGISDGYPDIIENANKVQEMGGNGLLINYLPAGLSMLRAIAEDPSIKLPILAHMDFAGTWYQDPWSGVASNLTLGKIPRLCGADSIVLPAPYGKAIVVDERFFMNIKELTYPLQNIKPTMPMPSGGITAGMIEKTIKDCGKDVMIGSGGGVHAHPDGPEAGARSLRQAIDAAMKGIPAKEYAKDHEELAKAIGVWGTGRTKFQSI